MMNMNLELIVRPYVDKVEKWEFDEVVLEYSGAVKISFKSWRYFDFLQERSCTCFSRFARRQCER